MGSDLRDRAGERKREREACGGTAGSGHIFSGPLDEKKPHQRAAEGGDSKLVREIFGNLEFWRHIFYFCRKGRLKDPPLFLVSFFCFFSLLQSLKFVSPGNWDLRIQAAQLRERKSEPRPQGDDDTCLSQSAGEEEEGDKSAEPLNDLHPQQRCKLGSE